MSVMSMRRAALARACDVVSVASVSDDHCNGKGGKPRRADYKWRSSGEVGCGNVCINEGEFDMYESGDVRYVMRCISDEGDEGWTKENGR